MTNREIQKKVKEFKKKFGFLDCDLESLEKAIEKQGYTIVEFNHIMNNPSVATIVNTLGLKEYISHSKCFTYADKNYRIVFVHEDLNEEERIKVLAHENGHIYLGHIGTMQIMGSDVSEEYDANEFAHYLQANGVGSRVGKGIKKHKKLFIAVLCLVVAAAIGVTVFALVNREKQFCDDYYITATGFKYHKEDCIFVKDKTSAKRMTVEQFESGEYEPCKMCLP